MNEKISVSTVLDLAGPILSDWDILMIEARWKKAFEGSLYEDTSERLDRAIRIAKTDVPTLIQSHRRAFAQHRDVVHALAALLYQNTGKLMFDPNALMIARHLLQNIKMEPNASGGTTISVVPYPLTPDLIENARKHHDEIAHTALHWSGPLPEMMSNRNDIPTNQKTTSEGDDQKR